MRAEEEGEENHPNALGKPPRISHPRSVIPIKGKKNLLAHNAEKRNNLVGESFGDGLDPTFS